MIRPDDDIVKRARSGKPYALLDLKQALAPLPADEAFSVYCRLLDRDAGAGLLVTKAVSLQRAAKERGKFYRELAPAGEPFVNRAPRVIGDGNHRDLEGLTRTAYVACFAGARIWSRSAAIECGGEVLLDFEDWELARIDDRLELDPRIFRSAAGRIWHLREPRPPEFRIERAFMLTGAHTAAFGHWLWEYLPKYVSALAADCMPELSVLIDDDMPATQREILIKLVPEGSRIVQIAAGKSVEVDELWCAPSLMYMPMLEKMNAKFRWDYLASPASRFLPVIAAMNAPFPPSGGAGEKVFLARRAERHRKLVNAGAIEAMARDHGFGIVHPEDLAFSAQVELVRAADYILGPEGSAMFLGFFARPGTKLAIFNHPYTAGLPVLTAVLEALGLDVCVVTGPVVTENREWQHFSDYQIAPDRFADFLGNWLAV